MQLRLMEYFVALAREQHFARAAIACNVSQPTLSMGIATLERQLGRRLVERDRRYIGLTAEGHAALPWAQQAIAAARNFREAAPPRHRDLHGTLRLGAIPAAMPVTGYLTDALQAAHPQVALTIRSLTSRQIAQGLAARELDAGLTYLDHESIADALSVALYVDRFVFVAAAASKAIGQGAITWREAVAAPLCLLSPDMQNRRILDEALARSGLAATPRATADSHVTLVALVRSGRFATIMPASYATLLPAWARVRPIDGDAPSAPIGLVVPDRPPLPPLAQAALSAAGELALPPEFGAPS